MNVATMKLGLYCTDFQDTVNSVTYLLQTKYNLWLKLGYDFLNLTIYLNCP